MSNKFNLQQNGLMQQGYCTYTGDNLKSISNGLRFTPLLCMFLAIYGLVILQNPNWHFVIAALGIIPFWFPNHHPLIYFIMELSDMFLKPKNYQQILYLEEVLV